MKKASLVFIIVCLVLCAVPSAGMLLFGPAEAGANEVLTSAPSLLEEDGSVNMSYFPELTDYVSDRFFLRQELITAGRKLEASVFHSSGEDDVILGRDGWLFYASTLNDYTGTGGLTERELYSAARNLALIDEYCGALGVDFLFTVAPNKNSLYGEYMPYLGAVSQEHDAQRLHSLLDVMNVPYLDLFSLFSSRDDVLYFSHDSHWTGQGAALAADAVNAVFGDKSDYFSGSFIPEAHTGDLYEMLYPAASDDEQDMIYSPALTLEYETGGGRADSITIVALGSGERRLFAYRDSFGNSLYPYLADSSSWARFSRSTTYDLAQVASFDVDCLLIELVERKLGYLIDYPPVLPAPERDAIAAQNSGGALAAGLSESDAMEGFVCLSAQLPFEIDGDSPAYLICGGKTFEASLSRDGFSAFIPAGLAPEQVLIYTDGELSAYDIEIS